MPRSVLDLVGVLRWAETWMGTPSPPGIFANDIKAKGLVKILAQ